MSSKSSSNTTHAQDVEPEDRPGGQSAVELDEKTESNEPSRSRSRQSSHVDDSGGRRKSHQQQHKISKDNEFWVQLRALVERNVILKRRKLVNTLFEMILPLFPVIIFIAIQLALQGSDPFAPANLHLDKARTINRTELWGGLLRGITEDSDNGNPVELDVARRLAIAPRDGIGAEFAQYLTTNQSGTDFFNPGGVLHNTSSDLLIMFDNTEEITDYVKAVDYGRDGFPFIEVGVAFTSVDASDVSFVIRETSQAASDTSADPTSTNSVGYNPGWQVYIQPWGALQDLVEQFLIRRAMVANGVDPSSRDVPEVAFVAQPFPEPRNRNDAFFETAVGFFGLVFTMFYLYSVTKMTDALVREKELRIKEHMKTMGLQDSVFPLSWFVIYLVMFFVTAVLSGSFGASTIFEFSNVGYIIAFFFAFGLATFAFAYFISAFFTRVRLATTAVTILFTLTYFIYNAVGGGGPDSSRAQQMAACISIPACFSLGYERIAFFESALIGINSDTVSEQYFNLSLSDAFGMLVADFFLYVFLGWYLGQVLPSKYGTRRPPYFMFQRSYWSASVRNRLATEKRKHLAAEYKRLREGDEPQEDPRNFEAASDELNESRSIVIQNLVKEFPSSDGSEPATAVDHLSLDVFEGQILSLLGHNGAGKTTLINMLTGFYPPTDGDAFMLGASLTTDIAMIRKKISMCPQHDVLYPILTVREQLSLYASIKGVERNDRESAVTEMISIVGLEEHADKKCDDLSGGMKRKLSVGMALIGDSKIVFLDEPTSGMDTHTRREFWDLIREQKRNRTIILTTHYMDEADYLGDRIAIMAAGKLKCWGTSLFLKNRFGVGYTMVLSKKSAQNRLEKEKKDSSEEKDKDQADRATVDEDQVSDLILKEVDGAKKLTSVATELSFRLPFESSSQFPALFDQLDERLDELGLESYGISVTTLEEVFLRVSSDSHVATDATKLLSPNDSKRVIDDVVKTKSEATGGEPDADVEADDKDLEAGTGSDRAKNIVLGKCPLEEGETPFQVFLRQFVIMFKKRFWESKRDRRVWLFQIVYPMLVLLWGVGSTQFNGVSDAPALLLSATGQFNDPNIVSYNGGSPRASDLIGRLLGDEGTAFARDGLNTTEQFQEQLLTNLNWEEFPQPAWRGTSQYSALMFDALISSPAGSGTEEEPRDVVFFNTTARHSFPITVNTYNNLIGRSASQDPSFKMTVSSHPLPLTAAATGFVSSSVGVIAGFALMFSAANVVFYVVRERKRKTKHQQLVSGASPFAYWMSMYAWDIINFLPTAVVFIIVCAVFNITELIEGENLAGLVVLLLSFAVSIQPFAYLVSFMFTNPVQAQSVSTWIFLLTGGVFPIVWIVLIAVSDETRAVVEHLVFVFALFPPFCVAQAIVTLTVRQFVVEDTTLSVWDWNITSRSIVFMWWEAVVYFGLVLLIEKVLSTPRWHAAVVHWWDSVRGGSFSAKKIHDKQLVTSNANDDETIEKVNVRAATEGDGDLDVDVVAEAERVASPQGEDDFVRLLELRRDFGEKTVVRNISFGVPTGQIFGFLGTNGAGKTTTLRILSGDLLPTSGQAFIAQHDISVSKGDIAGKMGYCPQFDALFDYLTGREHLIMYSHIKGVKVDYIDEYVDALVEHIGLTEHKDKPSNSYSGGTKRKLSVGISMIGDPDIVFLDEPTTGMDPGSRRFVWDLISSSMSHRSVVLTTHSMDEAQALCDRIAIMVNGQLRCIGSFQHLKFRYGSGYQVDLSVDGKEAEWKAIHDFFDNTFETPELLESHAGSFKFRIGKEHTTLSDVFRTLEDQRDELGIKQYSVSETTLEQIFEQFAKEQEETEVTPHD